MVIRNWVPPPGDLLTSPEFVVTFPELVEGALRQAQGAVVLRKRGGSGSGVAQLPVMSFAFALTFSIRFGVGVVPYRRGSGIVGLGIGALVVGPS